MNKEIKKYEEINKKIDNKNKELKEIAKKYCEKMNYTFIFANEQKFGFEDKKGNLWTLTYFELYEKLGGLK